MGNNNTGVNLKISNDSTIGLYRHQYCIVDGTWNWIPPEEILPHQTIRCSVKSTKLFSELHGRLQYNFVIEGIAYILGFQFHVPIGSTACFSATHAVSHKSLATLAITDLLNITWNTSPDNASELIVDIRETLTGKHVFQEWRETLRNKIVLLNRDLLKYGYTNFDRPPHCLIKHRLPKTFMRNIVNTGWKQRLDTASRSIYIRVVNLTVEKLVLGCRSRKHKNRILPLKDGLWIQFPSEYLESGGLSEIAVVSSTYLTGCEGNVRYYFHGLRKNCYIEVHWQYNLGTKLNVFMIRRRCQRLSIVKHVLNRNQATVIFHILDPQNLPKLELLDARAIPCMQNGYTSHLSNNPSYLKKYSRPMGQPVLTELINYLRQKNAGKHVEPPSEIIGSWCRYACTEFVLCNPTTLFRLCRCSTISHSIPSTCLLYLEWQIGSEIFRKIWQPNEKVWLYTGFAGGTIDNSLIFYAETIPLYNFPSLKLLDLEYVFSLESNMPSRNLIPHLSIEELLEGLINCMQTLALGLQIVVHKHMTHLYGSHWFKQKRFYPSLHSHLWKNQFEDDIQIDLEGILYIIIIQWKSVFEELFTNVKLSFEHIQQLQKVCLSWAEQSLNNIDLDTTQTFFETALLILTAMRQTNSAIRLRQHYKKLFCFQ